MRSYLFDFQLAAPVVRPIENGVGVAGDIVYRLARGEIAGRAGETVKLQVDVSVRLIGRFSAAMASTLVQTVVSPLHSSRGGLGKELGALLWA